MYSSIAHSCTNNTVVAGYHDSRRNTDTPYRSLWRYICSSCARAGVFPGIPVCPVYRFFLVLPLQAGKSGYRLYCNRLQYLRGVCRGDLGACRPTDNYSSKEQTEPNQNRSFLWSLGAIQLCKRPIPKYPLGFGLRGDQKTKSKPELSLS